MSGDFGLLTTLSLRVSQLEETVKHMAEVHNETMERIERWSADLIHQIDRQQEQIDILSGNHYI